MSHDQEPHITSPKNDSQQEDTSDRISLLGSPLLWVPVVILAFVVLIYV